MIIKEDLERKIEQFSLAYAQLPSSVVMTDSNFNIVSINNSFENMYGYTLDEVIGKSPDFFNVDNFSEKIQNEIYENVSKNQIWKGIALNRKKDDSTFYCSMTISALIDEQGQAFAYIGTQKDITEKRKMHDNIAEAKKMDSIGSLAAGIAHDFNNMLGGILGYSSLLLLDETNPEKITDLQGIVNCAQRGSELTQKLLAFARKGKNIVQPICLNELVDEVYSILDRSLKKSIVLETDFEKDIFNIDGDQSQFYQIIMNLCVNASESMNEGGTLTVETQNIYLDNLFCEKYPDLNSGKYVKLIVKDTGCGISKDVRERLFEPYFTTKEDGDVRGTGLGLSITYGIVKNHNGIIDVESDVNKGTSFILYFPKGEKQKIIDETLERNIDYSISNKTILIVEDEELVRTMSKKLVESLGYRVITANDGLEGVDIYKQNHSEIDAVLLDMKMPRMGGKEAFIEMQKINPDIKVLLSTGYGNNEEAQDLIDLGVKDLLTKPYQIDDLSDMLSEII